GAYCVISSSRPGLLITSNFGAKCSQRDFAISLTLSNRHRINARSALFSEKNESEVHLHGPGTGITNLPSFSAIKFSVLLVELPLASFVSILMTSFLVGLSVRQTLPPVGESCGVAAFFTSSGVRLTRSILEIFPP